MKCPFCQCPLSTIKDNYINSDIFPSCPNHPSRPYFYHNGNYFEWVVFNLYYDHTKYQIYYFLYNKVEIYNKPNGTLIHTDANMNISPETAQNYLIRILNLKAFL